MDQYDLKSNKLLLSIGQLSESRSKKVLIGFCHDLINVEKKTLTEQKVVNNNNNNNNNNSVNTSDIITDNSKSLHLIDLCFNQVSKTLNTAQPSILWKIVEYSISELDYLERILDLYKENSKENGKLLSSASSRLDEISSLLQYLQTLPKMNTPEYIELIGGINAHIKKITLRIKGELEQNRYSNSKKYGWIEKRCGNNQSFRTWKKMWFILADNHELYYYIKEKSIRKNHSRQLTTDSLNNENINNEDTTTTSNNNITLNSSISSGSGVNIVENSNNNNCNIVLEGELGKKKEGKGWKIRWMKLFNESLMYYKSQKEGKEPLGIIDLRDCQDCEIYKDDSNKFTVIHSVNKYYFQTDSKDDLMKWVEAVKFRIRSLKDQNKPLMMDLSTFQLKGVIDLSKATNIQESCKFNSQPHCISIGTDKKNYYFSFDSQKDKMDWLNTFLTEPNLKLKFKPSPSSSMLSTATSSSSSAKIPRKWEIGSISRGSTLLQHSQSQPNSLSTVINGDDIDDIGSQILPRKITMSQSKLIVQNNNNSNSNNKTSTTILQQQQNLLHNQSTSTIATDDSDDGQDDQLVSMLIPESLKNEIMRKSAYNLLKTFKLEIFLSNTIQLAGVNSNSTSNNNTSTTTTTILSQDIYTFLFSDSVLVDQVKAYAFKKIPTLKDLNLIDYRLGIDEDNILEIEFLKFIYSHTMVEMALKTCGIVKIGIFHHSKDRRVKEKLYPEKYQPSLSNSIDPNTTTQQVINSTNVITPLIVGGSNFNNSPISLTPQQTSQQQQQQPMTSLSISNSSITSTSSLSATTTTTTTASPSSLSTMSSTVSPTSTFSTSTTSTTSKLSLISSPQILPNDSPLLNVQAPPQQSLLISKCSGWNIENVSSLVDFKLSNYQPKFNKQEHGFYRKYIFESSQGAVNSFLGTDTKIGPLAFSLVKDLQDNYRGVLHSKFGAKTICVESKQIQIGNLTSLSKKLKTKKIVQHLLHEIDPNIESKVLQLALHQDELQKELLSLEERQTTSGFKFGLVYCKQGQTTDDEIFSNQNGSKEWDVFLDLLGDKIELLNWPHYSAGLDVRMNSTGTHSLYSDFQNNEVMFHVSTMLPYSPIDPQQIERKRQVGNDICVVIFNEGTQSYSPNTIASHFNHVVILVHYNPSSDSYKVSCSSKDGVGQFEPNIPSTGDVKKNEIKDFLLTKLINGELASLQAPVFSQKITRTRESLLNYYIEQFL